MPLYWRKDKRIFNFTLLAIFLPPPNIYLGAGIWGISAQIGSFVYLTVFTAGLQRVRSNNLGDKGLGKPLCISISLPANIGFEVGKNHDGITVALIKIFFKTFLKLTKIKRNSNTQCWQGCRKWAAHSSAVLPGGHLGSWCHKP